MISELIFRNFVGTIRSLSFQMAFAQRFNEVTSEMTHISELEVNRKYPIEHADKVTTRFGDTVLQSIRVTAEDRLKSVPPTTLQQGVQGRRPTSH